MIVLGHVPGTQIFISFAQALILWLLAIVSVQSFLKYRQYQKLLIATEQSALYLAVIKKPKRRSTRRKAK